MDADVNRLLDPNRIVYLKRTLRYPENEIVYQSEVYWIVLAMLNEIAIEPNTKSLRILEIEDI